MTYYKGRSKALSTMRLRQQDNVVLIGAPSTTPQRRRRTTTTPLWSLSSVVIIIYGISFLYIYPSLSSAISSTKDALIPRGACHATYPKQIVVHKLSANQQIKPDGRLEEEAWEEIPWSEPFVDIQGDLGVGKPRYDTRVKLRYDDKCLWVAACLEEPQAWANITENNRVIYHDNDFEIFVDPNGDTQFYKELEINAMGKQWNLMLVRPYINGGPALCNESVAGMCYNASATFSYDIYQDFSTSWDVTPRLQYGVFVNGSLNDPARGSKDWSLEVCLPLEDYVKYEEGVNLPPREGDYWRINFSRVQYEVYVEKLEDGTQVYRKNESAPVSNWVFQPMNVVQMHLPERWGYLYFTELGVHESEVNDTKRIDGNVMLKKEGPQDSTWPVREALAQVYEAEKSYDALYGSTLGYTDSLNSLVLNGHLSDQIAQGYCTGVPSISLSKDGFAFEVRIPSEDVPGAIGHINQDRKIWFTKEEVPPKTFPNGGNTQDGSSNDAVSNAKVRGNANRNLRNREDSSSFSSS